MSLLSSYTNQQLPILSLISWEEQTHIGLSYSLLYNLSNASLIFVTKLSRGFLYLKHVIFFDMKLFCLELFYGYSKGAL